MSKFANFVQCSLVAAITAGATSIEVQAEAPYNLPPDPAGETAFLTLTDSIVNPTAFEIIAYTGVTVIDASSVELTGVSRAQQGTAARGWDAGTVARQDLTAAQLGLLSVPVSLVFGASNDTTVRALNVADGSEVWVNSDAIDKVITLAAADDYLYSLDVSGNIRRINPATGQTIWTTSTTAPGLTAHALSVSRSGDVFYAPGNSTLKRFNATTGAQEWSVAISDNIQDSGQVTVDADGNVFAVLQSGDIMRTYPDGSIAWEITPAFAPSGIAAAPEGFIYIGALFGGLKKIDYNGNEIATTGAIFAGAGPYMKAVSGFVFLGSPIPSKYDSTLSLVWSNSGITDAVGFPVVGVDHQNNLYINSSVGTVMKIDADTGDLLWSAGEFESDVSSVVASGAGGGICQVGADGFRFGSVRWADVSGKPVSADQLTLTERAEPPTPPTGYAILFLDEADGGLKVKFDTGTVTTLATP